MHKCLNRSKTSAQAKVTALKLSIEINKTIKNYIKILKI